MDTNTHKCPWIICPTCEGDGTHSRNLGSFSAEEFCRDFSEEERQDYFNGAYDSQCGTCEGLVKVRDNEESESRHDRQLRHERIADNPHMAHLYEY